MMSTQDSKTHHSPTTNALAMGMAIKKLYEMGRKDFDSENFSGLKLSCCKLSSISFTSSDLRNADLDLTDL
ncbi:MAG: pentapeptide repeat-containing protein, partial [Pseudanabaena sp. M074S1SP2A07QC]|nr:pentapeptide repeat-containing protein [Pseudanabaena sp. M074S1SP2A07QC]